MIIMKMDTKFLSSVKYNSDHILSDQVSNLMKNVHLNWDVILG